MKVPARLFVYIAALLTPRSYAQEETESTFKSTLLAELKLSDPSTVQWFGVEDTEEDQYGRIDMNLVTMINGRNTSVYEAAEAAVLKDIRELGPDEIDEMPFDFRVYLKLAGEDELPKRMASFWRKMQSNDYPDDSTWPEPPSSSEDDDPNDHHLVRRRTSHAWWDDWWFLNRCTSWHTPTEQYCKCILSRNEDYVTRHRKDKIADHYTMPRSGSLHQKTKQWKCHWLNGCSWHQIAAQWVQDDHVGRIKASNPYAKKWFQTGLYSAYNDLWWWSTRFRTWDSHDFFTEVCPQVQH